MKDRIDQLKSRIQELSSTAPTKGKTRDFSDKIGTEQTQMLFIQGGTFQTGSPDDDSDAYDDEKPQHEVTLSDFYLSKYPVTQAMWRAVMGSDPKELKFKGCDQCPVEGVSWNDAQEFLKKLNSKTGKSYRLPSEAEWEFAARGGQESKGYKYAGGNDLKKVGWFDDNSEDKTYPVGELDANELGLHDMSGNVWEWCQDWNEDYSPKPQTNPQGPKTGYYRVMRGGCWYFTAPNCRVTSRRSMHPGNGGSNVGFRLAHSL
jgi:formylglycine-generating enzyme required for sulfatase activity